MDRRVIIAVQKYYPQGIPTHEVEHALGMAFAFAASLGGPEAPAVPKVATSAPRPVAPVQAKRPRGRPPGSKSKKVKAPVARPAPAPEALASGDSLADRARELLQTRGPMLAKDVEAELHVAPHPLFARIGAKPVDEVELEDGQILKRYGLPA